MLTPKEIGGGRGPVYPVEVPYSALLTSYTFSGAVVPTGAEITMALSFKPAVGNTSYPVCDPTNHYLLLIRKSSVGRVYTNVGGITFPSYQPTAATTMGALLAEVITFLSGSTDGYYSNLYVCDNAWLYAGSFFALSPDVADLWTWKKDISVSYGTSGGHYDFHDSGNLGLDVSGNGNHWTITGTQSDDTPTHNGGVTAWEALAELSVRDTSKYADVLLRTGTGAPVSITSLDFQPDFVNMKARSAPYGWICCDSVRGATKYLETSGTYAEGTISTSLTEFLSSGYALGEWTAVNQSGVTFADIALKADPRAGFDIVTYTGDGVAGLQIPHNLGKAPTFMLVKSISDVTSWEVYHVALGATKRIQLGTAAATTSGVAWNNTEPTATHFTVGNALYTNSAGLDYIAYLFTDTDVFRAFSYTGNGSVDGPEVDLGGRPLSIPFQKNATWTTGGNWFNRDALRNLYNPVINILVPNDIGAEITSGGQSMVFRSNGFKVTTADSASNGTGHLIVGLAVLRQPFKYSNAF